MHTVDTDTGHEHQTQVANQQAAVLNGVRHGQDPCPNVALQYQKIVFLSSQSCRYLTFSMCIIVSVLEIL